MAGDGGGAGRCFACGWAGAWGARGPGGGAAAAGGRPQGGGRGQARPPAQDRPHDRRPLSERSRARWARARSLGSRALRHDSGGRAHHHHHQPSSFIALALDGLRGCACFCWPSSAIFLLHLRHPIPAPPPPFRPMPQSHQKYSLPEAQGSLRDLFLCIIECREHVLAGQKSRPARACMACQDPAAPRSAAQQSDAQHSTCRLQSTVQASSGCLRCATCSPCPRDCFRGCFLPVLQNVVCLHGSSSSRRPAQQISRTFPCTATVNVPQLLM